MADVSDAGGSMAMPGLAGKAAASRCISAVHQGKRLEFRTEHKGQRQSDYQLYNSTPRVESYNQSKLSPKYTLITRHTTHDAFPIQS